MKKLLVIGSTVLIVGLLIVYFTTPIFAQSPGGGAGAKEENCEMDYEIKAYMQRSYDGSGCVY